VTGGLVVAAAPHPWPQITPIDYRFARICTGPR